MATNVDRMRQAANLVDVREREVVASFRSYDQAEAAVEALADRGFPVRHLTIVAEDLVFVESVTGRRSYASAAWDGVGGGLVVGGLLGFFFGLFDWVQPLVTGLALALYGAALGSVIGGLVGVLLYTSVKGRRDFESVGSIQAGRYLLTAGRSVSAQAKQQLSER